MPELLYNIGILAHVDAGKTTLTEQLLYLGKTIRKAGRVDDGTAQTDWLEVERRRGISVRSASSRIEYKNAAINLIDTPGHTDFAGEVERSLMALDCAVLLISAVEGVQSHTRLIWQALQKMGMPALIVVNKIDRMGSSVEGVLGQIKKQLTPDVLPLQTVLGEGTDGCQVLPFSFGDPAFDEEVLASLSDFDPEMETAYLEEQTVPPEVLKARLSKAVRERKQFPLLFASGKLQVGCMELLDAVLDYLPPAGQDDSAPLSGLVYKVEHDPVMGKAAHVRLFGGCLKNRDSVLVKGREEPQKITQIRRVSGAKATDVGEIHCGDIGAVYGLDVRTGDILGEKELSRSCSLAVPLLQVQAFPETEEELPALTRALRELSDEDPLLDLLWLSEERELHLHITGVIQLEILTEMIKDRYGLNVSFSKPSVIYKETPASKGVGFEAYTMPKPCWAVVELTIEPLPRGSGIEYSSVIKDKQLFYRYQNHVKLSVFDNLKQGPLGWEVTDARITLTGGGHHTIHTHPLDFFVATPVALLDGLTKCGSILLEPMLKVTLTAPEEYVGKVLGDIIAMRGTFESPAIENGFFTMEATLPVATSMDYPIAFRSLTSGKGNFSSQFCGYQECPLELGATCPRRGVNPLDRSKWILWARNAINLSQDTKSGRV